MRIFKSADSSAAELSHLCIGYAQIDNIELVKFYQVCHSQPNRTQSSIS